MRNFNEKSKIAYNKKADDYDNTADGKFTRKFKELLVNNIELNNQPRILDVACGNASLLTLLNKKMPIEGFGIDISENMIRNAKERNPEMKFYTAGCEAMPFQDSSMDIIAVCSSYHHFPDVTAFAREAMRVLKSNGKIYIADIYLPSILRKIINPFVPLSKDGDVKFYSPREIIDNFNAVGFENLDIKIHGHIQIILMRKIYNK